MASARGPQIFLKSRIRVIIIDARKVIRCKLLAEYPQILGATVQNGVCQASWRPGFVQPWPMQFVKSKRTHFENIHSSPSL
jgi:hypothetical protein